MENKRSSGSWLGGFSGFLITISFFLPWVRACGSERSGYDLATSNWGVEDPWVYWASLAAGVILIGLHLALKSSDRQSRQRAAAIRFFVALLGAFPLINIFYNVQERSGSLQLLYGAWLTALGYAGVLISLIMDLRKHDKAVEAPSLDTWGD